MRIWLDAQLSPKLANWLRATFDVRAFSLRDVDMKDAKDERIFLRAKDEVDAILTKDEDFLRLVGKHGPPPSIIWVTIGNTSNRRMKELITDRLPRTLQLIKEGNAVVEIAG